DDGLAVLFAERDRRSEPDFVRRDLVEIHQLNLADALLQQTDAGLDEALALLGRLVFGVLAEVAQFARALDLSGELRLQLLVELGDFVLEFLQDPVFHVGNGSRKPQDNRRWHAPNGADHESAERPREALSRPRARVARRGAGRPSGTPRPGRTRRRDPPRRS